MNITKLKANIAKIENSIVSYRKKLEQNSSDFSSYLTLRSLEAHKRDLTKQLRTALTIHSKEIIEIHLEGKKVNKGEVPLRLLADISEYFTRAVQNASNKIINGYDTRKVPQYIQEQLSLSFVGLAYGSSRLYISANTNPDIFGDSLAENTLKKTFEILQYETIDDFMENIDAVGLKSLKNWHSIFAKCLNEDTTIKMRWVNAESTPYEWKGNKDVLKIWKKRIEMIDSKDLGSVEFDGVVYLLSLSGRLEIVVTDELKVKSVFPIRLLDDIRNIGIGDYVKCSFKQKQVIDISKGVEKISYTLESIHKLTEKAPAQYER